MYCYSNSIDFYDIAVSAIRSLICISFLFGIPMSFHFSVNGNWSGWSPWPNCNKPCNGGNKTRKRQCDNSGARNCEGPKTETEPCNLDSCPGMHLVDEVKYDFISRPRLKLHECSQSM